MPIYLSPSYGRRVECADHTPAGEVLNTIYAILRDKRVLSVAMYVRTKASSLENDYSIDVADGDLSNKEKQAVLVRLIDDHNKLAPPKTLDALEEGAAMDTVDEPEVDGPTSFPDTKDMDADIHPSLSVEFVAIVEVFRYNVARGIECAMKGDITNAIKYLQRELQLASKA